MSAAASDERDFVEILLAQLARFAAENIDSLEIDRTGRIPESVREGLAELGLFSLSIPEEFGGAGFSLEATCEVVSALAEYDRSVATMVGLHLGLGTRGLIAYGSDELRQAMLPKLASGEWVAAFAATEANAGSDLTAIATRGLMDEDALVLNGAKAYVTNGGFAEVLTLLISTPGLGGTQRGHSLVCLRRSDPGLSFGPEEDKLGLRASSTRPLFIDNVHLDPARVIGTPGQGMDLVYEVLAWGRTAMAAGCLGAARAAMNKTVDYATTREQFGRPLIEQAVVREQLSDMSALLFTMGALVRHTARLEDAAGLSAMSTSAKIYCSEADWEITDLCMQLHGGIGFLESTGVPVMLRDARITRIFEGANDVLRIHAGGLAVASRDEREPLAERFADAPLAASADAFATLVSEWIDDQRKTYRIRLLRNHRMLHAIGSAVTLRDAVDAAAIAAAESPNPVAHANAEHWLQMAGRRLRTVFEELPPEERLDTIVDALRNKRR